MKIIAAFLAFFYSSFTPALVLQDIVVFGDSLSDFNNTYEHTNHTFPIAPYLPGRFTNKQVWVEHLVNYYYPQRNNALPNKHLLNYAYGGASVREDSNINNGFTLQYEIEQYMRAHGNKLNKKSLFIVWIGANNYLTFPEPQNVDGTLHTTLSGLNRSLQYLADHGATYVLVMGLPDLGKIPIANAEQKNALLSELSVRHNALLQQSVAEFQKKYPNSLWMYLNIYDAFNDVIDKKKFSFDNVTDACMNSVEDASEEHACDKYAFFDSIHPSGELHRILAEYVKQSLDAHGITFK